MPDALRLPTCPDCDGRGATTARLWVLACAHMLLMLDDDLGAQARGREMHPYFREFYTSAHGTRPSADIREFGTGLAGREGDGMHDAIDGWRAMDKVISAAGLDPKVWGYCARCGGNGDIGTAEEREAVEDWKSTDPPTGDGWQVWETVSEGSPISPVFPDREGLIQWLMSPAYSWGISQPLTRGQAEGFTAAGWAPSMVAVAGSGVIPGEQWVGA